jgi:hypothetical protein
MGKRQRSITVARPRFEPTAEQRTLVEDLVAFGNTDVQIAQVSSLRQRR